MAVRLDSVPIELAHLAPVGTPERREWDRTIREVNELYPDWSMIHVGKTRFRRETYEQQYKGYYERDESLRPAAASPDGTCRRRGPGAMEARPGHRDREPPWGI
jgi:hypothetical protein